MKYQKLCILLFVAILLLVFYLNDPGVSGLFPTCPFYWLTGLYCPGCGSQRAMYDLMHFNVVEALGHNVLVVLFMPLIVYYFSKPIYGIEKLDLFIQRASFARFVLLIILLFWLLRNLNVEWARYLQPDI